MFQSYRLVGDYEKPWLSNKAMKSTRWNDLIVGIFILSGIIGAGVIGFFTVWPYRQADVSLVSKASLKIILQQAAAPMDCTWIESTRIREQNPPWPSSSLWQKCDWHKTW